MANATRAGHGGWSHGGKVQDGEASYFVPPWVYTQTLAAAVAALQAKIQEMVLENSLVDATDPSLPSTRTSSTITTACFRRT